MAGYRVERLEDLRLVVRRGGAAGNGGCGQEAQHERDGQGSPETGFIHGVFSSLIAEGLL